MYLSEEDILNVNLSLREVIDLVEKGLGEHGKGLVENPPKPGIHASPDSFIHAMPAYFKNLGMGVSSGFLDIQTTGKSAFRKDFPAVSSGAVRSKPRLVGRLSLWLRV
jgi:hypothetical protein